MHVLHGQAPLSHIAELRGIIPMEGAYPGPVGNGAREGQSLRASLPSRDIPYILYIKKNRHPGGDSGYLFK
jgi:hypothetical protein